MKKVIWTLLAAAFTFASCTREDLIDPNPGGGSNDGNGGVAFRISVPGATAIQTRAIDEKSAADNRIDDLMFLLFDPTTEVLVDLIPVLSEDISAPVAGNAGDPANKNLYEATLTNLPAGEYKAIVMANYTDLLIDIMNGLPGSSGGHTLETITDELVAANYDMAYFTRKINYLLFDGLASDNGFYWRSSNHQNDIVPFRPFAMAGFYHIPAVRNSTTMPNPVRLFRDLAKININGDAVRDTFVLREVRVRNLHKTTTTIIPIRGEALSLYEELGNKLSLFNINHVKDSVTYAVNPAELLPVTSGFTAVDAAGGPRNSLFDVIFLPEQGITQARRSAVDNFEGDSWKEIPPAVLICGWIDLNGDEIEDSGEQRWFRANLRMNDDNGTPANTADDKVKHVNILRNHSYTINIIGVEGVGYDTADEAYNALPGDLVIGLTAIDDTDLNDFAYNGQYYLATGRLETYRSWESDRAGGYELVQNLKVYTDYPGGWKIENIVYPNLANEAGNLFSQNRYSDKLDWYQDWLTVETPSGPQGSGTIRVRAKPSPAPTHRLRPAAFDVVAGSLRLTVRAEQLGGGFLASPGVLGVGVESGKLTLRGSKEYAGTPVAAASEFGALADETVYVVYFKWGSLIASTSAGGHEKRYTPDDLVWAPAGFHGTATEAEALAAVKAEATLWHNDVPYRNAHSAWDSDVTNGLGDPCAYAESGTAGKWRLPVGGTANGGWNGGSFGASINQPLANYWVDWGVAGHGKAGLPAGAVKGGPDDPDWSMFLPFTGGRHRLSTDPSIFLPSWPGDEFDGRLNHSDNHNQVIWGRYWSGTSRSDQHGEYISFTTRTDAAAPNVLHSAGQSVGEFNWEGLAIRCVIKTCDPLESVTLTGNPAAETYPVGIPITVTATAQGDTTGATFRWEVSVDGGTSWADLMVNGEVHTGLTYTGTLPAGRYYFRVIATKCGVETTSNQIRYAGDYYFHAAPGVIGIKHSDLIALRSGEEMPASFKLTLRGSNAYNDLIDPQTDQRYKFVADSHFGPLEQEPVYMVHYKFGSLVARVSGTQRQANGRYFSAGDIVWVPDEYIGKSTITSDLTDYGTGMAGMKNLITYYLGSAYSMNYAWNQIPYLRAPRTWTGGWPEDLTKGLGDPCHYVDKGTATGDFRVPSGDPRWAYDLGNPFGTTSYNITTGVAHPFWRPEIPVRDDGTKGGIISLDGTIFLPISGRVNAGSINETFFDYPAGYYWAQTTSSDYNGDLILFTPVRLSPWSAQDYTYGHPIRCVRVPGDVE